MNARTRIESLKNERVEITEAVERAVYTYITDITDINEDKELKKRTGQIVEILDRPDNDAVNIRFGDGYENTVPRTELGNSWREPRISGPSSTREKRS